VLLERAVKGAFGRSFDTGRIFRSGAADLAALAAAFAMSIELVLSLKAALIGALITTGADETFCLGTGACLRSSSSFLSRVSTSSFSFSAFSKSLF